VGLQHIVVYRMTPLVDDKTVMLWCEAANIGLRERMWPHWGRVARVRETVGEHPPTVSYMGASETVVANRPAGMDAIGILVVQGRSDYEGALGYHYALGKMPAGRSFVDGNPRPAQTFMHEVYEMACNPFLDLYWPGPGGRLFANEVADPVQREVESIRVERQAYGLDEVIESTNAVLPAYFGLSTSGQLDLLGNVRAPFWINRGGYQIVRDAEGNVAYLQKSPEDPMLAMGPEKFDPLSRTHQIMAGVRIPRVS
jgi:hypothetical protein